MSDNSSRRSSRSRQWWFGAGALLVLCAALWWFWPEPEEPPKGGRWGNMTGPIPVRLAEVRLGDFAIDLKALGTVTAYNTVNVRSRVDGELVEVAFEEGQEVEAGDLLAVIDPRPYQVALQQTEGRLLENEAQLKNAELDLQRYRGLYAEDSIARQMLDTQEALVRQYQGNLKSYQADVANAKLNLEFTRIHAPISGRLGLRQLDIGNQVKSGDTTPLVVITQTDPIAVLFTIPEGDLPAVLQQLNQGRRLLVEAWDRGGRIRLAEGHLESLDNQIDTATGSVKLKARFANDERLLFPNQFVNVRLRVETRQDVLIVPSAAVHFGGQGTFAFVVDEQNEVQLRTVVIDAADGEQTLISQGLQAGERVVLEGTDRLREGSLVEVVEDARNGVPVQDAL